LGRLPPDFEDRLRDLFSTVETARLLWRIERDDSRLDRIVRLAAAVTAAESGVLLLSDEDRGDLVVSAAAGPGSERLSGTHLSASSDVAGMVLATGEPLAVADPGDGSVGGEIERRTGLATRNLLAVPFEVHGTPAGVLELRNTEDAGGFGPEAIGRAAELASIAAAAVEDFRGDRFLLSLFAAALPRAMSPDPDPARAGLAEALRDWLEDLRHAPGHRAAVELVESVRAIARGGESAVRLCRSILEAVARRERSRLEGEG
jgi:GAF domain-containing protein